MNSSEGAEKTLWSLFQVTSDFKAVNSKSLIEEFGDVSLIKEALILSEESLTLDLRISQILTVSLILPKTNINVTVIRPKFSGLQKI